MELNSAKSEYASIYKTCDLRTTNKDRVMVLKSCDYIHYIELGGRLGSIDYFRACKTQRTFNIV